MEKRSRWGVLGWLVVAVLALLVGRYRHRLAIQRPWSLSGRLGSRPDRSVSEDMPGWSEDSPDGFPYEGHGQLFSEPPGMAYGSPEISAVRAQKPPFHAADLGRSIAFRAELRMLAQDVTAAAQEAQRIVGTAGGYTVQAQIEQHEQVMTARVVLAVPSMAFQKVLEELRRLPGISAIQRESVSGQDVTTEVIDLESRVRAARATEERLVALLQRAEKVKDVLQVEEELKRLQYELERLEAQQRSLQERTRYALVILTLHQIGATLVRRTLDALRGGWREGIEVLADTARAIGRLAANLTVFAPLVVMFTWLCRWLVRRFSSVVLGDIERHHLGKSLPGDDNRGELQ